MTVIERIVRPFQTIDRTPPIRRQTSALSNTDPVVVEIGEDNAEPKILEGSFSQNITLYMDQKQKAKPIDTVVKRVRNKDDESQYVDIEAIERNSIKYGSGKDFQRIKSTHKDEINKDAEIIDRKTYSP